MKISFKNASFLALFAPIVLSGCGSFCDGYTRGGTRAMDGRCGNVIKGQQSRDAIAAQKREAAQQQYINSLRNRCSSFGFQQGTTPFAQCVMQQQQADTANAAAAQAKQNAQPAYDPLRAPAIVPMGNNGLTSGNSALNCTPDGRGGYNCR